MGGDDPTDLPARVPGEQIGVRVDQTLTQDATGTAAYLQFETMGVDRVRTDLNIPGHVLTLQDRPIFKPDEDCHWPGQENLQVHRQKCFN